MGSTFTIRVDKDQGTSTQFQLLTDWIEGTRRRMIVALIVMCA